MLIPAKTLSQTEANSERCIIETRARFNFFAAFKFSIFCCKQRARNLEAASELVPALRVCETVSVCSAGSGTAKSAKQLFTF